MPDLEDYGALLRSGAASVPDYATQEAQRQLVAIQRAQEQRLTAEAKNTLQEQRGFQSDLTTVLAHPSAQGYSALIAKHPKFAQQVKSSWDLLDKNRQDADLQQMSEVYSAAANGKSDLAAGLMQRRIDADKTAGQDTTHDQAILDALNSGDPVQQKGALGMIGVTLSAVTGPEKFEQTYGALTKGTTPDIRNVNAGDDVISIDPNTHQATSIYKSPYVKTADGGILERDGTGGGDPASGGAGASTPAASGGPDNAITHVLKHEGGYLAKDGNGYPTNFGINAKANSDELGKLKIADIATMTKPQAIQIYKDKYWPASGAANLPANLQAPYFDVYIRSPAMAKQLLATSGGDPVTFATMAKQTFQQLAQKNPEKYGRFAKAWANRDDDNIAATGGVSSAASPTAEGAPPGYHWLTRGSTPDQYRNLTPAEATQRGLDPSQQYQLNTKTGQLSGLGKVDPGDQPLPGDPSKEGQAYLDSLPPGAKALGQQAKLLTEGRLGTISSFALSKPYWQKVLQLATQYDHTFDMNMAPTRKAALTAFTGTGKGAMLVGSINRVANHMDLLWNESKKLAGPNTGFGPLDTALAAGGQAFERPDAKAYDTEVTFVAGELGKLAKAGVVTEGEVDKIIGNLSRKNATPTRESAIQAAVGIISGAVDPLKDQYNSAFVEGSPRPTIPWVTPKAQEIFKRIGGVDLSLTGAGAGSNAPAASSSRQPPAGATKTATGPNGQKAALVNGHWVVY